MPNKILCLSVRIKFTRQQTTGKKPDFWDNSNPTDPMTYLVLEITFLQVNIKSTWVCSASASENSSLRCLLSRENLNSEFSA